MLKYDRKRLGMEMGRRRGLVVSWRGAGTNFLLFHGKAQAPRTCCFMRKGGPRGIVVLWKRAGAKDLLFQGKKGHGGLVIFTKGRRLGLVFCRTLYNKHVPNRTGVSNDTGKKQALLKGTCLHWMLSV
jgi:hypothetical protein